MRGLRNCGVVITRAPHQAVHLARLLTAEGAQPVFLPLIEIAAPDNEQPLIEAVGCLSSYDWLVFTSANSVEAVRSRITAGVRLPMPKIAVIGTATLNAVEQAGWKAELIPPQFVAEGLVEAFKNLDLVGKHMLLPKAAQTREVLAPELRNRGAIVDAVIAYQNKTPSGAAERARRLLSSPQPPDWITFLSSSAMDHLVDLVGIDLLRTSEIRIAAIGPVTGDTIRLYGLGVDAEPSEHTAESMVRAMQQYR